MKILEWRISLEGKRIVVVSEVGVVADGDRRV